jgi:hypothetical protein
MKSTCVTTMKAMSATMSAAVSARECWGRGRKCHCQTGSSYR